MVVEVLLSFGIVVVVMFEELLGMLGLVARHPTESSQL